jgi:putative transcriptional regulator
MIMNEAFDSIKKGLEQAIQHASGKGRVARVHRPVPVSVQKVRKTTGMTQPEFAATFGISVGTLRHWERGDREPRGAALVLLNVIQHNPKAVLEALEHGV